MSIAAQPGLYDAGDAVPALHGTRCRACASTFFPPLLIGCEVCGAAEDALARAEIPATGILHSVATVHARSDHDSAPFTVAEVHLDAGPFIRGIMMEPADIDDIGLMVEARWAVVRIDDDGNDVVEPRFALVRRPGSSGVAR